MIPQEHDSVSPGTAADATVEFERPDAVAYAGTDVAATVEFGRPVIPRHRRSDAGEHAPAVEAEREAMAEAFSGRPLRPADPDANRTAAASVNPASAGAGSARTGSAGAGSAGAGSVKPGSAQAGSEAGSAGAGSEAAGSDDVEPEAPDRPWRRAARRGAGIFVGSKIGLAVVSAFAWLGDKNPDVNATTIAAQWAAHWDSVWFRDIAARGYFPDDGWNAPAAFFPMYPALIRLVTPLCLGKDWIAALLVANVASLLALVVLYRLTELEFGSPIAGRTTFYLVAFPTGLFLTAAYNEGLFIGLMCATVYCLRRQHWWWAGAIGGLAAFTRSAGILLAAAFVYEYVRVHRLRLRSSALAVLLVPLGLAGVAAISMHYYHQPLAFLKAQQYWGRHLDWPFATIWQGFASLHDGDHLRNGFGDLWLHNLLELGTVLLVITMLVLHFVGPWKVRRDQWVMPFIGIALTLLMISFPSNHLPYPLYSASRLGLEVFPAFMLLGRLGARPIVDRIVVTTFLILQANLAAYYVHGGWVA